MVWTLLSALLLAACHSGSSSDGVDSGTGTDTGTDTVTDTETAADTDADTDTDDGCSEAGAPQYTWCDEATGLLWENPHMDAPGGINLNSAVAYCASLGLGDFNDWHVPTIDELRTLIRACPATEPRSSRALPTTAATGTTP
jgi:hypothetical protein